MDCRHCANNTENNRKLSTRQRSLLSFRKDADGFSINTETCYTHHTSITLAAKKKYNCKKLLTVTSCCQGDLGPHGPPGAPGEDGPRVSVFYQSVNSVTSALVTIGFKLLALFCLCRERMEKSDHEAWLERV